MSRNIRIDNQTLEVFSNGKKIGQARDSLKCPGKVTYCTVEKPGVLRYFRTLRTLRDTLSNEQLTSN